MVAGVVTPLIVNSVPVSVSKEIVSGVVPVLFTTRLLVLFDPTETFPKLMEFWLNESCDCALTPVADRLITTGVLPLLPVAVSVPVKLPAAVGVTATVKVPVCPTARAIGVVIPETLNCVLESETCVTLIATLPVFDTVTVCVDCLPTVTEPKLTLPGLSWNDAVEDVCFGAETTPAQPASTAAMEIRAAI
jgi:hypothetical protein